MFPAPTESRLIGCSTELTRSQRSKLTLLTPKTNLLTFQPKEIAHVMIGIIYCACSQTAISVLQCALIQWRNDLNKIQEENGSQQNRDRWWILLPGRRRTYRPRLQYFTRDEWNHLLRLFNIMSFLFSCSHFSNFLSDPIGKQSAMSKWGQEAACSQGSPMAKPRPMIPAKTRPINLVSHSPWSASRIWDIRSTWRMSMKDKVVKLAQGNVCRPPQSPEVEYSQVRRQENAKNSDSWKQCDQVEASTSTSTRRFLRAATPRTEFQNMKYANHQYMTKFFHFLQKKLGITAGHSTFSMEALKTNVLMWWMFMSSSTKAAIHLGPNYLANYAMSHRNWSWSIVKRFWMWIRLTVHLPHGRDPYCLMTK